MWHWKKLLGHGKDEWLSPLKKDSIGNNAKFSIVKRCKVHMEIEDEATLSSYEFEKNLSTEFYDKTE